MDLVKVMEGGGNMENVWIIFDCVKHLKNWTTMACHVYHIIYCKVIMIVYWDMQFEGGAA